MSGNIERRTAELESCAAQLENDQKAAQQQLRADLLSGASTRDVRTFIAELAGELAAVRRQQAEIAAVEEAAAAFAIDEAATAMAARVARDLQAKLVALQAPPHPLTVRH